MSAGRRRRLKASEVVRILKRHGFEMASQRGSHQKWVNSVARKIVIVPMHQGRDLPIGTLMSIVRGSGIPQDEWFE
jgi:predicted RNA binding protein YcfA (HicA-like mRNA interferase family)